MSETSQKGIVATYKTIKYAFSCSFHLHMKDDNSIITELSTELITTIKKLNSSESLGQGKKEGSSRVILRHIVGFIIGRMLLIWATARALHLTVESSVCVGSSENTRAIAVALQGHFDLNIGEPVRRFVNEYN